MCCNELVETLLDTDQLQGTFSPQAWDVHWQIMPNPQDNQTTLHVRIQYYTIKEFNILQ